MHVREGDSCLALDIDRALGRDEFEVEHRCGCELKHAADLGGPCDNPNARGRGNHLQKGEADRHRRHCVRESIR